MKLSIRIKFYLLKSIDKLCLYFNIFIYAFQVIYYILLGMSIPNKPAPVLRILPTL